MTASNRAEDSDQQDFMGGRFIFIGGAPRSGTTLLQNMLDSHPEVIGGPEFLHLPGIMNLRSSMRRGLERKWIDLYLSDERLDVLLRRFIGDSLLPLVNAREGRFLSEKTPENVLVFSELLQVFPESRCIHVVRDPRATVASLLEVGKRARKKRMHIAPYTSNVQRAMDHVKRCLAGGFEAQKAEPRKVLTVRYERLASEPAEEGKRVCNFLGLSWESRMLKPADFEHLGQEAITKHSGEVWYDAASYNRNPSTESVDKWRRQLSLRDQLQVSDFFRDNQDLSALGYDFSPPPISRPALSAYRAISRFDTALGKLLLRDCALARRKVTAIR